MSMREEQRGERHTSEVVSVGDEEFLDAPIAEGELAHPLDTAAHTRKHARATGSTCCVHARSKPVIRKVVHAAVSHGSSDKLYSLQGRLRV